MKKQNKSKSRSKKQLKKPAATIHRFGKLRFLPAVAIALLATFFAYQPSVMRSPTRDVLAYATNTSVSGLLTATNAERSANGVASLSSNGQLNAAAQAKAEDMVARNYWAHETPDGKQPWVFITNAGYQYSTAGENLAYGYLSSGSTVTGWMNSPPHKTNLLGAGFTEVGFGIANSPDYVGSGQQTVVVAMYAKPMGSTPAATAPVSTPKTKPATQQAAPAPAPEPAPEPEPTPEPVAVEEPKEEVIVTAPAASDVVVTTATSTNTKQIQLLTNGLLSASAVALAVCAIGVLWVIHKGFHLRRYVLAGEHFVAKHLHIDLAVLAIIYLGFVLLSTSGVVR